MKSMLLMLMMSISIFLGCSSSNKIKPLPLITGLGSSVEKVRGASDEYIVTFIWRKTCEVIEESSYRFQLRSKNQLNNIRVNDTDKNEIKMELPPGSYEWAVICLKQGKPVTRSMLGLVTVGKPRKARAPERKLLPYTLISPSSGAIYSSLGKPVSVSFEWKPSTSHLEDFSKFETEKQQDQGSPMSVDLELVIRRLGGGETKKYTLNTSSEGVELSMSPGSYLWSLRQGSTGRSLSIPAKFQVKRFEKSD